MAQATLTSISEYLATTYRPDCDYLEGELRQRHGGERPHAMMQAAITGIINANRRAWHVVAGTEQRLQVSPLRFRIPDVCILRRTDPVETIVRTAPLACIEILSPTDTLSDLQIRVQDYLQMGTETIWVIDPLQRRVYVASATGFQEPPDRTLTIAATPIRLPLEDLFAEFDDLQRQY